MDDRAVDKAIEKYVAALASRLGPALARGGGAVKEGAKKLAPGAKRIGGRVAEESAVMAGMAGAGALGSKLGNRKQSEPAEEPDMKNYDDAKAADDRKEIAEEILGDEILEKPEMGAIEELEEDEEMEDQKDACDSMMKSTGGHMHAPQVAGVIEALLDKGMNTEGAHKVAFSMFGKQFVSGCVGCNAILQKHDEPHRYIEALFRAVNTGARPIRMLNPYDDGILTKELPEILVARDYIVKDLQQDDLMEEEVEEHELMHDEALDEDMDGVVESHEMPDELMDDEVVEGEADKGRVTQGGAAGLGSLGGAAAGGLGGLAVGGPVGGAIGAIGGSMAGGALGSRAAGGSGGAAGLGGAMGPTGAMAGGALEKPKNKSVLEQDMSELFKELMDEEVPMEEGEEVIEDEEDKIAPLAAGAIGAGAGMLGSKLLG